MMICRRSLIRSMVLQKKKKLFPGGVDIEKEKTMNTIINPFAEKLECCLKDMEALEERLAVEKENKNHLLASMESFYTEKLKNAYFKWKMDGGLGQISHAFVKRGELFVHLYTLEITSNSKLVKKFFNVELFGNEMENLFILTEAEYKEAFFHYVDSRIKIVETEGGSAV